MFILRERRNIISVIVALTCFLSLPQPVNVYAGGGDVSSVEIIEDAAQNIHPETEIGLKAEHPENDVQPAGDSVEPETEPAAEASDTDVQPAAENVETVSVPAAESAETDGQPAAESAETDGQPAAKAPETEVQAGTDAEVVGTNSETESAGTDLTLEAVEPEAEPTVAITPEETAEETCVGASPFLYAAANGGICVTGYTGSSLKLSIPSSIDGKNVVSVGDEAFRETQITSVTLPSTVTYLGKRCFYRCEDLQTVNLNACTGLTKIGEGAFAFCGLLSSIKVPDSVTAIEDDAFFSCGSLKTVTMGSGVAAIGTYAFALCRTLTAVSLPAGLKTVESNAFEYCEKMTSVTIAGATDIGNNAFAFAGISAVKIPASCKTIGAGAFHDCDNLASVTLQEGLLNIGRTAFANCDKLLTVTVPNTVTTIGDAAFGCAWGWDGTSEYTRPNTAFQVKAYKTGGAASTYASRYGMKFIRIAKTIGTGAIYGIKSSYNYIGSALKPAPTVKDGAVTLKAGTDYTVTYSGNTEPGTAVVTVKGIGNYSGNLTKKFTVAPYPIYGARITATTSSSTYDYTGYARKPGVTVKFNGTKLTAGTDYTLTYSNNTNPGTGMITLTGRGRFRLTREVTFTLALTVPTVTSAVKKSAGTMQITWKKYNKARGYQVRIARGTDEQRYTLPGADSLSKTISGLKTNQTWRVYVRSYQKIGTKYYYSAWSGLKYVKV